MAGTTAWPTGAYCCESPSFTSLASVTSLGALATPAPSPWKLSGTPLAVTLAIPATLIAVPWLVTLYMWQAFALPRCVVLENRHARDAIGKARFFLHGHLLEGLKLIVACCSRPPDRSPGSRVDRPCWRGCSSVKPKKISCSKEVCRWRVVVGDFMVGPAANRMHPVRLLWLSTALCGPMFSADRDDQRHPAARVKRSQPLEFHMRHAAQ